MELREYITDDGKSPFAVWLARLDDRQTRGRILARLGRVRLGNLGDAKSVGGGVFELRMPFGPGYRIYFGRDGDRLIILLCAGDKASRSKDIARAKRLWADYARHATMANSRPFSTTLEETLRDPTEAAAYLNAALDEDPAVFLQALKDVAKVHGGMAKIAEESRLNRESLYRMLSANGNPRIQSLNALLHSVGLKLQVAPEEAARRSHG